MTALRVIGLLLALTTSVWAGDKASVCSGRVYRSSVAVPCSHTWVMHATCTGEELVHAWKVDGNPPGDHYLRPFADTPIIVIGYEMVKKSEGETDFFMIGSGHQPDAFLWMARGENRVRYDFPPGHGHPWPSKQEAAARRTAGHEEMINVHGTCVTPTWRRWRAFPVTMLVTVYYVAASPQ